MTDLIALKQLINDSGMTMVALSKKSGIARETLYNRLNGIGEFRVSEIRGLAKALCMSSMQRNKIFFGQER